MGVGTEQVVVITEKDADKLGPLLSRFPDIAVTYWPMTQTYTVESSEVEAVYGALRQAGATAGLEPVSRLPQRIKDRAEYWVLWSHGQLWACERDTSSYVIHQHPPALLRQQRGGKPAVPIMQWPSYAELVALVWQCRWQLRSLAEGVHRG